MLEERPACHSLKITGSGLFAVCIPGARGAKATVWKCLRSKSGVCSRVEKRRYAAVYGIFRGSIRVKHQTKGQELQASDGMVCQSCFRGYRTFRPCKQTYGSQTCSFGSMPRTCSSRPDRAPGGPRARSTLGPSTGSAGLTWSATGRSTGGPSGS